MLTVDRLHERVGSVHERVDSLHERIDRLHERVDKLHEGVHEGIVSLHEHATTGRAAKEGQLWLRDAFSCDAYLELRRTLRYVASP